MLLNHSILGEGYYFIDSKNNLTILSSQYKKVAKKLNKRGYTELTEQQLDSKLIEIMKEFLKSISEVEIEFNNETITNILYLWYENGFCHYKTFNNGIIDDKTISGNIKVNDSSPTVDNYPIIQKFGYGVFNEEYFNSKSIYADDLNKLYFFYKDKL